MRWNETAIIDWHVKCTEGDRINGLARLGLVSIDWELFLSILILLNDVHFLSNTLVWYPIVPYIPYIPRCLQSKAEQRRVELEWLHSLTRGSTELEENQSLRNQIMSSKTLQSLFMKFLNIRKFPFFYCHVYTVRLSKEYFLFRPETTLRLFVLRGSGFAGW